MRRRIAVLGATDAAIEALPRLATIPDIDLVCVYDADAAVVRRRLALHPPASAALLHDLLTDDPNALAGLELVPGREAVALVGPAKPEIAGEARPAMAELGETLDEITAAAELVAAPQALHARLLEAAIAAAGATGGSLLCVDDGATALRVAAAVGLERELWDKVSLGLGQGLAGRAWAERRSLVVAGRADAAHFEIARERHDLAAAACIPLVHGGEVLGVLCLHHATRSDLFGSGDLEGLDAIGVRIGRLCAAANAAQSLQRRARLAEIDAEVRNTLAGSGALELRLASLCRLAAARAGAGIASLWWNDHPSSSEGALRMIATSLPGGALGAAASLVPGQGIDGRAARDRVPILLPRDGTGTLAYLALPLLDRAQLRGVLSVQVGSGEAADASTLIAMAASAAEILARDAMLAEARERAASGDAVHEAALRLLGERDVQRLADALASSAALLLDAEHVVVRVLDGERRSFRLRARAGSVDPLDDEVLALDRRAAREVLRLRAPIDAFGDEEGGHAFLIVPIRSSAQVLGTLGFYGKRSATALCFGAQDRDAAERLASYAAHALEAVVRLEKPVASRQIVSADLFARRLDEEIARARASAHEAVPFVLLCFRIENAAALGSEATALAAKRLAAALATELRAFDAAAQTAPDTISVLLPEPSGVPAERVARLARSIAQRVAAGGEAAPLALAVGYAVCGDEDSSGAALLAKAATPRLRML